MRAISRATPQLPLDIKHRIVDYVLERSPPQNWLDIGTLRALSLTSREWSVCSRPHLFTETYLRPDNIAQLLRVVKENPIIGSWLKTVYLFGLLVTQDEGFAEAIPVLAELAPLLPKVQRLRIEQRAEFGPFQDDVYEALSGFKSVQHVVLSNPHMNLLEFGKLFSALPHVPEWRVSNATTPADLEDEVPTDIVPPNLPLQSLALSQVKVKSANLFQTLQAALRTGTIPNDLNPFLRAVGSGLEEFVLCFSEKLFSGYGDNDEPPLNPKLDAVDFTSLTSLRSLSISCVEDESSLWNALNRLPLPGRLITIITMRPEVPISPEHDPELCMRKVRR